MSLLRSEHPRAARARPGGSQDKGKPGAVGRSRPGKTGARRHPHRPPRQPRSRVRVLPNTLDMAGNSRSKERSVPEQDVIQTSCQRCAREGGNNPQTHTLTQPKDPAPLVGAWGDRTHRDALLRAPGPKQRQAKLNKKPPKPQEVHFYPSVFSPVGPTRVPCQSGRRGGCWEGPVRACTAGTATPFNSKKQFFPFLGGFFF